MQGAQFAATASAEAVVAARYQLLVSRRRRLRAPLVAIDRLIDVLELGHLAGRTVLDDRVCQELAQLSTLIPLTDSVTGAADTRTLHAALLDLQEEVLEAVIPSRQLCIRQDDE